ARRSRAIWRDLVAIDGVFDALPWEPPSDDEPVGGSVTSSGELLVDTQKPALAPVDELDGNSCWTAPPWTRASARRAMPPMAPGSCSSCCAGSSGLLLARRAPDPTAAAVRELDREWAATGRATRAGATAPSRSIRF